MFPVSLNVIHPYGTQGALTFLCTGNRLLALESFKRPFTPDRLRLVIRFGEHKMSSPRLQFSLTLCIY